MDTTLPALASVPLDATVECDSVPAPAEVTATDNCDPAPVVTFAESRTDGPCPYSYTLTRTWTATDNCGNSSSATQTITVQDTTAPVLSGAPSDVTVECDSVPPNPGPSTVTATDNCDAAPVITFSEVRTDGACPNSYTVARTWTATDACGNPTSETQVLTVVDTTAPVISWLDGAPLLVPVDGWVDFNAEFYEACGETNQAEWDFGDTTVDGPAAVTDPVNQATAISHQYVAAGIYMVSLTIIDDCGNPSETETIVVVVYDPAAGFTTGGGWFIPDAGSFVDGVPVTDTSSKANFGFVAKYKKGATNDLSGNIEFVYKAGDINLHSLDLEWLVITSESKISIKGLATINGEGLYTFKITARDNGDPGTNDHFKIEIWLGVEDTENGVLMPKHKAQGLLGGGNIKIHD